MYDPTRTLLAQAERVAGTGSWLWEPATGTTIWSEGFRALLGLPPDTEPGSATFFERVHPEDRARCVATYEEVLRTGVIPPMEYRVVRPDGAVRYVRAQSARLDEVTLVGTLVDVTDLRRADAEATDARAFLASAESVATMGAFVFFPATGTRVWSDGLYRLLGLEPGAPLEQDLRDRFVHPEDRGRFEAWGEALRAGSAPPIRLRIVRADGAVRRVEQRARWTTGGADRQACVMGVVLDVTEASALEERAAEAEKSRVVGALAQGVAHDLGNWLTVMRHQAEQLPAGAMRAEMEQALGSCVALTRELLALAHRRPSEARLVELRTAVEQCVPILRRAVGSKVQVELEPGKQPAWTFVDPAHLEGVLLNLAVNARDAMPQGGRLRFAVSTDDDGSARLDVADTGVGIGEEHLKRLFEPYFTTKDDRGHGLGLASVRGTVRQHGGDVSVESRVGSGTTFTIRLPPRPAPTVLVVDDLPEMRSVVARSLARAGLRTLEAADGLEALAVLEREPCALVVTDWGMPRMDGLQLVRALEARGGPKAIVVTGQVEELDHPGVPVLRKPFRPKELLDLVLRTLARG